MDIIGVSDDLCGYQVVITPLLYMTKANYDKKLRTFVKQGGTLVTTFFSGIVDEHDLVITGGYPGKLRDILGIWVEEQDALPAGMENSFVYQGCQYPAKVLCDIMHLESAKEISEYEEDFYKNTPVITKNEMGKGAAYYVGTRSSEEFYLAFLAKILKESQVCAVMETPKGVEVTKRQNQKGTFIFLINHNSETKSIILPHYYSDILDRQDYQKGDIITLESKGVKVLRELH